MPTQPDLLARAGVVDYVHSRLEVILARSEQRTPRVRLDDVAALEARLGPDDAGTVDALVAIRARHAFGNDPLPETEEFLADVRDLYGAEVIKALTDMVDTVIRERRKQGDELRHVTLPATVTAQTRSTPTTYYVGTWEAGATYNRGAMVTDKGKLWHCEKDGTCERPGGSPAFKMMHK